MPMIARRSMLKGAGAVTAASLLARFPGARLIQAQGNAEYDVIALVEQTGTMQGGAVPNYPDASVVGLNSEGDTCGWVAANEERTSPAVWSPTGKLKKLESGKFGGTAYGLNALGLVAGAEYAGTDGSGNRRAAAWLNGERIDLHAVLPDGNGSSFARGINDLNQVLVTGDQASYIVTVASADDLAIVEVDRSSYLGNDGQILGIVGSSNAPVVSFIAGFPDDLRTVEVELPADAGLLNARAINEAGTILIIVAGKDLTAAATIVIEGDEQTLIDLRSEGQRLGCWAMNGDGVLAGELWDEDDERSAVIVVDGEIVDLNERISADVGVKLARAININDAGMVLTEAFVDELSHYFLLVPAGQ